MSRKILIIDDHAETIKLVGLILKKHGYEVHGAQSGLQGISQAEQNPPDLILLDMMMPGMDGIEVCKRIRANPRLYKTPIIMFTASSAVQEKWAGFQAGVNDYLTKPTQPSELVRRVEAILEQHKINENSPVAPTKKPVEAELKKEEPLPIFSKETPKPADPVAKNPVSQGIAEDSSAYIISVIGARGGGGTTTMAINFAYSLAEENQKTILADLDLIQGHISIYLNQKIEYTIHKLFGLTKSEMSRRVRQHLVSVNDHLQLLLSRPNMDRRLPLLDEAQATILADVLNESADFVVVDLGGGLTKVGQAVLEYTDEIILCLRPERISLVAGKQLIRQLKDMMPATSMFHVVLVDYSQESRLPISAVEKFIEHPIFDTIPYEGKELADAVNQGIPLVSAYPESKASQVFKQLARQLTLQKL